MQNMKRSFLALGRGLTVATLCLTIVVFTFGIGAEASSGLLNNKSYFILLDIVFYTTFAIAGLLIFLRKSDNWMALAVSSAFSLYGATGSLGVQLFIQTNSEPLQFLLNFLLAASTASVPILAYLFPNGRFVPSWTRWLALVWVLWASASLFLPIINQYSVRGVYSYSLYAVGLGSAIFAQVYRYRRVSNQEQKQQSKWVLLGFAGVTFVFLLLEALPLIFPLLVVGSNYSNFIFFYTGAFYISQLLVPLCISFSILRYRLWDIDIIINKSLVYILASGLCIIALGLADKVAEELLGSFLTSYVSQFVSAVISILAVGLAFLPLKSRVEEYVNHKFYGDKLELHRALTNIMLEIRPIEDLKQLLFIFLERVCTVLDIAQGEILLRAQAHFVPVESKGNRVYQNNQKWEPTPDAMRLLEKCESLVASKDKTLRVLVPISLREEAGKNDRHSKAVQRTKLIGVLALGERAGGMGYSSEEKVLLLGLADQLALNLHLLGKSQV